MGLFGFGKKTKTEKIVSEEDAWKKVSLADLLFAYTKQGDPWGDQALNRKKLGMAADGNYGKAYKNCMKLGLFRPATNTEKLVQASMEKLREICMALDVKGKRSKAETREVILGVADDDALGQFFPDDVIALTDRAKAMLKKYDFIPYCLDHYAGYPLDYYAMVAARNDNPAIDIFDAILAGVSKEHIEERYIEDYLDDDEWEDDGSSEYKEWARDRKKDAKEDAREDYKELLAKIKEDKKNGRNKR